MLGVEVKLTRKYVETGLMRIVFHPVINHGNYSYQAHQGAECASDQGQFWPFREYLFKNYHRIWKRDALEIVKELGEEFGLDAEAFRQCMNEQRYARRIDQQDELRLTRGIRYQPTFDINGRQIVGMSMFSTLDKVIQEKLSE